jgi:LAO/AO transport system kinase
MIEFDKLIAGDIRTLAKAITLIESTKESDSSKAQDLLNKISSIKTKSFRLGISGSPGVGKSTFIENFGQTLLGENKKIAVLAIDPSSPCSGGSILGDKTRMDTLSTHQNVFIRPSPTLGTLGGVANKTREAILLCEAAGYDFIIVETVGVGQSEFAVASMVDFFMLLILPSGGDELQGIKKGILELTHSIIINKADGDNKNIALMTQAQYSSALHFNHQNNSWKTNVKTCSIYEKESYVDIYQMLSKFKETTKSTWEKNRRNQNIDWFQHLIKDEVYKLFTNNPNIKTHLPAVIQQIESGQLTPFAATNFLLKQYK